MTNRSMPIKVAVKDLKLHPTAQRELVPANVKRIYDNLDLDEIGTVHAVKYPINGENTLWVVDGQSRVTALMQHDLGEWEVDVLVHTKVKDEKAACKLFLGLNRRSPVSPLAKYKAEVKAEDPVSVGVDRIIKKAGLQIGPHAHDGTVCCVSALKQSYGLDDGKSLTKAFSIIQESWGYVEQAMEGQIVYGLSRVVHLYPKVLDVPGMVSILAGYRGGPRRLLGNAASIADVEKKSMSKAVVQAIVFAYNQRRRIHRLEI